MFFGDDDDHERGWFGGENNEHYIVVGGLNVGGVEIVMPSFWWCKQGRRPFLVAVVVAVLLFCGDISYPISRVPRALAIGVLETAVPLGLLEGLNQSVQKDAVKTTVAEFYVILVMLAEGVHRLLLCCQIPGTYRGECFCDIELEGYQG